MDLFQMLQELYDLVLDEVITNDGCLHKNVARPGASGKDFCEVCFIVNLYHNCSETEDELIEETTDPQRDKIQDLWNRYCDGFED